MVRVLKSNGFIFLIAPSAGQIHRYPVDCYRFYPEAYKALAKYTNCQLIDVWIDERGPWNDLVGIFSRNEAPKLNYIDKSTAKKTPVIPYQVQSDNPEEEIRCGDT